MAISTYKTFLMYAPSGNTYEKLVDIKEFPDLGKAPDTIDVTTLSDGQKMYIQDILDPGALEFTANYDKDQYKKLSELAGKKGTKFSIWLGGTEEVGGTVKPTGTEGKFDFLGELAVWVKGGGVSAAVDMGISITPSTKITKAVG